MVAAVILAILLAFLLAGTSYIIFPDQTSQQIPIPMPVPKPGPSLLDQIFWAILWIGLAAFIAIAIVGALLLISRIKRKKTDRILSLPSSYLPILVVNSFNFKSTLKLNLFIGSTSSAEHNS